MQDLIKEHETNTIITVINLGDFLIATHVCFNAPLNYAMQSAGDAYNCMIRYNLLKMNKKLIVVTVLNDKEPIMVIVNDDNKPIPKNYSSLWTNKKSNSIKVLHKDFNIDHYLPYPEIEMDTNLIVQFFNSIKLETIKAFHVQSLIWDKI